MADTLEIFGKEYTGVTGIKAKNQNGETLIYTRGDGGGNDFIITLSYDSTNEAWEPDCTFSEYATAFTSEKNIALKCNNSNDCSIVEMEDTFFEYKVTEEMTVWTPFLHGEFVSRWYTFDSSGITEGGSSTTYSPLNTTATAADITSGKTAIIETGAVVGTNSGSTPSLQSKTATPSETAQTITADSGYDGLSSVEVGAISSTYVGSGIARKSSSDLTTTDATVNVPAGYYSAAASKAIANGSATTPTTTITANPTISVGSDGKITATTSASQNVTPTVSAGYVSTGTAGTITVSGSNTSQLTTQAAKTVTPTESEQTAVAANVYTTGVVKVGAISSTYVGSDIAQNDSDDLTVNEATITTPAGYYSEAASKSVASGTAGTPTVTKGTVSNHSISVTPSVTNTTGYITGGTISGTAVSVSASELVSGAKTITANGASDVTNYASVDVDVEPNLQAKTDITPTESNQTITADNTYDGLSSVQINAISSNYVGSGITRRDSDDLTVSGATITAPAGYYSAAASKSVASMTLPTEAASSATSGYTSKATIGRSTSAQYINIPTGYNATGAYYVISATPNGSAATPATSITANPSITVSSSGLITATASASQNVTPTVSAGYVSSGTSGTITVSGSNTQQLTTKAAATYYPSTTDQTISASQYLTGAQTIKAVTVSGLSAANIASGVTVNIGDSADADRIMSVTGTLAFSTITVSSSDPSGGSDGDVWIKTS